MNVLLILLGGIALAVVAGVWVITVALPAIWKFLYELFELLGAGVLWVGKLGRSLLTSSKPPVLTRPPSASLPYPTSELAEWSEKTVAAIDSPSRTSEFEITVEPYPPALDIERASARPTALFMREPTPHVTQPYLQSVLTCEELDQLMAGTHTFTIPKVTAKTPPRPKAPIVKGELVDTSDTESNLTKLLSENFTISPSESELTGYKGRWYREKFADYYTLFSKGIATQETLIDSYKKLLNAQRRYNDCLEQARRDTLESFNRAVEVYDEALARHRQRQQSEKEKAESVVRILQNSALAIRKDYATGGSGGVENYFDLFLLRLPLPNFVPKDWELHFDETAKVLIVDFKFLSLLQVNFCKIVELKSGPTVKPPNKSELKALAAAFYPSVSLRLAREIVDHDFDNVLQAVCINGWVNHRDGATGLEKKTYISSMFATKDDLKAISLADVDPVKCFDSFKGRVVRTESLEVAPVNPVIRFDKNDKRFVEERDVLDAMKEGQNLAAIEWEEFEHLVRELFSKLFSKPGVEVRVTQASRDKGVDAVVFDPTPITGGKLVIQAKRYVNVVDVSSVRDLYGTLLNEGASKGILVTTSTYGADSYEFAKNKPIDLINGAELLGLLATHGYKARIDLEEARRLMTEQNLRR